MNINTPGFRTDSVPEHEGFDNFLGLDRIKRDITKIKARVGIGIPVPIVTGSTDADKIDSLISALAVLGLIKDQTT